MALMQITVIPLGTETTSVSAYIADIQEMMANSGIEYVLNDMETTIHADIDQLFTVAKAIHEIPFSKGLQRVVTNIQIDDRRDKERGLGVKRDAVLSILEERKK